MLKEGFITTRLPGTECLGIVRHTRMEPDRSRERVLLEEGAIEFQRRVSNVNETIVINTKDNPKY